MLLDSASRINGDLVISCIAVFHTEVVVLEIYIEVGQDQRVLDELPHNACHLIAIELYNCSFNFNFIHRYISFTSACLARTASAASLRDATSESVSALSTTLRIPLLPISASTPR